MACQQPLLPHNFLALQDCTILWQAVLALVLKVTTVCALLPLTIRIGWLVAALGCKPNGQNPQLVISSKPVSDQLTEVEVRWPQRRLSGFLCSSLALFVGTYLCPWSASQKRRFTV